MSWFISKIIFEVDCGVPRQHRQFEEQLRLVEATNPIEAYHKAVAIGQKGQESFLNQNQQVITWKFINVEEIRALDNWHDGMELNSIIKEVEDAQAYVNFVNDKASDFRENVFKDLVTTT